MIIVVTGSPTWVGGTEKNEDTWAKREHIGHFP